MKFRLVCAVWNSRDGYDEHYSDFNSSHIPGAYREAKWVTSRWQDQGFNLRQKAVLNEVGEPVIQWEKVARKPDKSWFQVGRNHVQVEPSAWEREIEEASIFIDINTMEDLIAFLNEYNGELSGAEGECAPITAYFKQSIVANATP